MKPHKVYILTDPQGRLIDINSDAFLSSVEGWQQIDEGSGDKYHHAQGNYLPQPVYDEVGRANWKLEGGVLVLRTEEEKAADVQPDAAVPFEPDADDIARLSMRMDAFDQSLDMLLMGVTEDA